MRDRDTGGSSDRHASAFLVRLPEAYRQALMEHKRRTDRPVTVAVRKAVDEYLRANGIDPPIEVKS